MKYWFVFIAACLCFRPGIEAATVTHAPWGQNEVGALVELYTIASGHAEVKVTTYGARIVSVRVPDRKGKMADIIVGRDSVQGYMVPSSAVMGATIGRYANRIDHGQFKLSGKTYQIPTGANGIALHGGTVGFNKKTWIARAVPDGVEMTLVSPDGDMGFPGTLTLAVRFTLAEMHGNPALNIQYTATTDKPTVVNFTNHSYFNLSGDPATPVLRDLARINADSYTVNDSRSIPTGAIVPVADTPLDFRTMHAIGDRVPTRGYDNNYVVRSPGLESPAGEVDDPVSGRTIQVYTTQPGLQFYVPLPQAPRAAAAGAPSAPRPPAYGAFCLETQHYPDAPNHPNFPSTELVPGQPFRSTTIYVFGVSHGAAKGQ